VWVVCAFGVVGAKIASTAGEESPEQDQADGENAPPPWAPDVGEEQLATCASRGMARPNDNRRTWRRLSFLLVGVTGFEPTTSWSRTKRSTKLSYTPKASGEDH
jgi:hypothetical protein